MNTRIELKPYDNWSAHALWNEWEKLVEEHARMCTELNRLRLAERETRIRHGIDSLARVSAYVAHQEIEIEFLILSAKMEWVNVLQGLARRREEELSQYGSSQSWT